MPDAPVEHGTPRVADVDWDQWAPERQATLLFIVRDQDVLLIHKKRGLGAGKLNGAGGHLDPGETPTEAAIREFTEELGAVPIDPIKCGEVLFHVVDGTSIRIHVFRSDRYEGILTETDEAAPYWVNRRDVPYDDMWADDRYWFPLLLAGERFEARTVFRGDTLLDYAVMRLDHDR